MANGQRPDMSCARVKQYQSANIDAAERHNERHNANYDNLNVIPERTPLNVHFRSVPDSYMDTLRVMEKGGTLSTRGLRKDATLFDEIIIDVNTMYFERNGGYEYAKRFYAEATHFLEKKFGAEYVLSAVMHADEINKAATDKLGKEVYHYHLHAIVVPIVDKKILWSKRCKDPALRGTVREVIRQVSHSKKWASDMPLLDEQGKPVLRSNGKPRYRPSYSVLQDELVEHMQEHGFTGFQRGELGSTRENLSSLQYQIEKDKERLAAIQERVAAEQVRYEPAHEVYKTVSEIETMGQRTLTGKVAVTKADYQELTALAKEGITSRAEIGKLNESVAFYTEHYHSNNDSLRRLQQRYGELKAKCQPFLQAMEYFPQLVTAFISKVSELLAAKEAQEQKAREERMAALKQQLRRNRGEDDLER